MDELVVACLEKEPSNRPASAAELSDRLLASVNGEEWGPADAERWWSVNLPEFAPPRTSAPALVVGGV